MAFEMMSDCIAHMDHLHDNPVDYGHIEQVKVWPYSTFHQLVERQIYPEDRSGYAVSSRSVKGVKTCDLLRGTHAFYRPGLGRF